MHDIVLLLAAGLLAGAMNALAGGGSFVTLPALIAVGLPSVAANASSTVALYPGGLASAWVYREGVTQICGVPVKPILLVTLAGGLVGALALLWTPSRIFDHVLPWLLLTATMALAFGRRLGPILRARFRLGRGSVLVVQFGLGVYGGYFGGAVGLMMMAAWTLLDDADVKSLNPPRTLMVTAANTIASLCFVLAGSVHWRETLAVAAGAVVGGHGGAHLGRRLPPSAVRVATLGLACVMTIAFFVKAAG